MTNRKIFISGFVSVILATFAISSLAAGEYGKPLEEKVRPAFNGRVVVVGPDTTYVNVTQGDVVKFVAGNTSFIWAFTGPSARSEIYLNTIAPPGMLDHRVKVYIEQLWLNNGP